MENTVEGNLSTASRGGVPGTLSLIEAFLKVKRLPTNFKFEVLLSFFERIIFTLGWSSLFSSQMGCSLLLPSHWRY